MSFELTEKIWFQKRFASSKQIFGIDKMLTLLLRINSPQIFTIYNIQALRKLSEDFQENILGGVILVYDRYSEQSVCNLTKRRTLTPEFSGEMFKNGGCGRLLLSSVRQLLVMQFAYSYNVRLNVNIEFLKITTSETLPSTE